MKKKRKEIFCLFTFMNQNFTFAGRQDIKQIYVGIQ